MSFTAKVRLVTYDGYTELGEREICGVESTAEYAFMSGGRFCSLEPDHQGAHRAYEGHVVTNHGSNLIWLGPWEDGRSWEDEESSRLQDEWEHRYDN